MDSEEPMIIGSRQNEEFFLIGDSFDERIPHITVTDDESSDEPTSDRETLMHCINRLAEKTYHRLMIETSENHRYYQRMFISNRIHGNGNTNSSCEEIKVRLPAFATAWNELDIDDLKIQMLKAVVKFESEHLWYQVKIHLDYPYDGETREIIEDLLIKEGFEIGGGAESDDHPERIATHQPQAQVVSSNQSKNLSNLYPKPCDTPAKNKTNPSRMTPNRPNSLKNSGNRRSANSVRPQTNKQSTTPTLEWIPSNDVPLLAGLFGKLAKPAQSPKTPTDAQAQIRKPLPPRLAYLTLKPVNQPSPTITHDPIAIDNSDDDIEIIYENVAKKQMVSMGNAKRK